MNPVPCLPETAPFTPEQRAWINGYLAGLFSDARLGVQPATLSAAPAVPTKSLVILYGSQTGSAEGLARRIAGEAKRRNYEPRLLEANAFASVNWAATERLLLVTSTWGDGDPPDNAAAFWAHLKSDAAPKLDHLRFAVLALGDRNYADFCGAGKKFDARLAALGARRLQPLGECDVDYEATAQAWIESLWELLGREGNSPTPSTTEASIPTPDAKRPSTTAPTIEASIADSSPASSPPPSYSRTHPYPARLVGNRRLNQPGSAKDTRHIEIELNGSGLHYEVGDALGVMPANCPALVRELIEALGCDGEEAVRDPAGRETSLAHALQHSFEITRPTPAFLRALVERSGDAGLAALLDPARKAELDQFLYGREIIDFLLKTPGARFRPAEFVGCLRKLAPRLYSIASSPKAHPGQVHLCVGTVRYTSHGRARKGVCSTFLADRADATTPVPVFVQTSHGFRLPADGARPVIMIGPGTGIAPFRAFLEERRAVGATGPNWLFFGDQQQACDYLYREELEAMQSGPLTRLDLAFSRDQAEKVYVQHRMMEHARELWTWLEDGAHVYVCGDARRMAKDVEAALHAIVEKAGGRTPEQAAEYVSTLKREKRYQRDVY